MEIGMNIKVDERRLMDEVGRERIYNGINIVFKGVLDESVPGKRRYTREFRAEDFAALKEKGINLVRLGIVWDAIEHEAGKYNEEYLQWIEDILNRCQENEISVYLDMHQDLYSRLFDGGAPEWATLTEDAPHFKGELWSDAYLFSEAVNKAYLNFWENKETEYGKGLQEHYQELWVYLAGRLGKHGAVIGYDFINEPFPGQNALEIMGTLLMTYSTIKGLNKGPEEMLLAFQNEESKFQLLSDIDDPALYAAMAEAAKPIVEPFEKGHLALFYKKMTKAVREITEEGLILTENNYFSNIGIESSVQRIVIEGQEEALQVYSPHGYDLVVDTPAIVMASNRRIKSILEAHSKVQERLNVPVIFGEWGAHGAYAEGLDHIKFILNYFDSHKWSHTYYCWQDGIEKLPVMNILSRPYPQAVAGKITEYGYQYDTKTFSITWIEEELMSKPTKIYLPLEPKQIQFEGEHTIIKNEKSCYLMIPSVGNETRNLQISF